MQDDFEKLFDQINRVTFDDVDRKLIVSIHGALGNSEEDIMLVEGVKAEGNIEDWLLKVEKEMQRTMRNICQSGYQDCNSKPLRQFIDEYPSQVALLGIQFLWTSKLQESLEANRLQEKISQLEKKKKEIIQIMNDLTAMCLEEIKTQLIRIKIETMVTIQVYQRD